MRTTSLGSLPLEAACSNTPPPITVLQIGAGWFPEFCAGGENVFYNLYKTLPGVGVKVHGLVVGSDRVRVESGGNVVAFSPRTAPMFDRMLRGRKAMTAAISRHRPDLISVHFSLFGLPILDKLGVRPLVVHFHGPWAAESMVEGAGRLSVRTKATVERLIYRRADRLIVLSRAFGEILCRDYGIDPGLIRVIPGGVDCARFAIPLSRRQARAQLGWDLDRPTILTVRRLAKRMGLTELITSIAEIRRKVPEVCLVIAGKGEEEANLRRLVGEMELDRSVRFTGFVPDSLLPTVYRAADMSVVPSTKLEGFGLITAESLGAGTPVLVTPVGGLPETVEGLEPALVLRGCAPDDLADGLSGALLGATPLPDQETCMAYARQQFDWPVIAAKTRNAYEALLS